MTSISLHTMPRWDHVAFEQIRAVGLRVRAFGVLFAGALLLYGGIAIRVSMTIHSAPSAHARQSAANFEYSPEISSLLTYLALLLPALIWHEESPVKRMYHSSMPVPRATHALTKALAGWVWAMAGTAFFMVVVVAIDTITRNIMGIPIDIGRNLVAWEWFVPFTSVTIAYAISSAAAIGAQTPAVWVVGVPVLYVGAAVVAAGLGFSAVAQRMLLVFSGYYGVAAAVAGQVFEISDVGARLGPSAARWLTAAALWGTVAAMLLWFTSRRRSAKG